MKHTFDDITSRIAEPPTWHDENGTPRYGVFSPDHSPSIYADQVGLFLISCQACDKQFLVEMSADHFTRRANKPPAKWHYGDPPRHDGCIGDSMNVNDLKVVEFWTRGEFARYERQPTLEGPIDDYEEEGMW